MDDLDREIEEAVRVARQKVWRGRLATIASTATFFLVGIAGSIVVIELFPEPGVSEFNARQQEHKVEGGDPSAATLAGDYLALRRDGNRTRWKVIPVLGLAFVSAYFVSKRLKPND